MKQTATPKKDLNNPIYNHRIVLTTYPGQVGVNPIPLNWGHKDPKVRGPILASRNPQSLVMRNTIGAHGGSYCVYRALAVAIGKHTKCILLYHNMLLGELNPLHKPDFHNTLPSVQIGPYPQWGDPEKIVSMDPWGNNYLTH